MHVILLLALVHWTHRSRKQPYTRPRHVATYVRPAEVLTTSRPSCRGGARARTGGSLEVRANGRRSGRAVSAGDSPDIQANEAGRPRYRGAGREHFTERPPRSRLPPTRLRPKSN